jgi:hypothetical protein
MDGWQLDRHISLGHLLTTITVAGAVMIWMFKLEGRVSVVESNINHMQSSALLARTQADQQYAEIIRRLERIDDNLNKARVEVP